MHREMMRNASQRAAWLAFIWADKTMMRDSWYFIFWLAIVLGWPLFVTFAE
jgi:hypothetical protein